MKILIQCIIKLKPATKPDFIPGTTPAEILKRTSKEYFPVVLLELADAQVYCFQTQKEIDMQVPHDKVYWKYRNGYEAYGPFMSVYQAGSHYSWVTNQTKLQANKIIKVDFKARKKL